ncbi:hypothetical protein McpSp1_16650 [Methanocorpusculaceae archaeon Sp1]|nr:hypothetical protein [Methanocorpusculaceae archaeon Sp1]
MKFLFPLLLLLAVLAAFTAGCIQPTEIQPQIPEPHPTPIPTAPPSSGEPTFWISDTPRYLSYWNDKMGWNLTDQTLDEYAEELNSHLDATWEKGAMGYHITNISDYRHSVKNILGLTEEQFDAFVTADTEQKKIDRVNHHSPSSSLYDTSADQT